MYVDCKGNNRVLCIDYTQCVNTRAIPEEFLSFARQIYDSYGDLSGDELEQINHTERPWLEARGDLKPWQNSNNVISEETMKEFYREMMV